MSRAVFAGGVAAVCSFLFLGIHHPALGGLTIVSENVHINRIDQQASFDVIFDHPPDWKTIDSFGRRADSFQIEVVPNTLRKIGSFPFDAIRAVIRGDEAAAGNFVPVRDGFEHGSDPSPASGGWGAILGTVPLNTHGDQMTFSLPFKLLDTTSGNFAFRLFTTNYGATESNVESVSVPLPPALPASIALLTALAVVGFSARRTVQK